MGASFREHRLLRLTQSSEIVVRFQSPGVASSTWRRSLNRASTIPQSAADSEAQVVALHDEFKKVGWETIGEAVTDEIDIVGMARLHSQLNDAGNPPLYR